MPGNCLIKLNAVMPPIEGPTIALSASIPRPSITGFIEEAISSMLISGKLSRYLFPDSGSLLEGPDEPKQLPKELTQITKYLLVSMSVS